MHNCFWSHFSLKSPQHEYQALGITTVASWWVHIKEFKYLINQVPGKQNGWNISIQKSIFINPGKQKDNNHLYDIYFFFHVYVYEWVP